MAASLPRPFLTDATPRKDLCPVVETIKIIGKKWYLIILHELTMGPKGFNELRRSVRGISAKVLSESLQHLERRGLVSRRIHREAPIRVEYALTPKGAELEHLFDAMKGWGEKWNVCGDQDAANARLVPEPSRLGVPPAAPPAERTAVAAGDGARPGALR